MDCNEIHFTILTLTLIKTETVGTLWMILNRYQ